MNDQINALQSWYLSQCNDVWEHSHGIEITNIDNPGWEVRVSGSIGSDYLEINVERDEIDWIHIKANETEFVGYGGPGNLNELLTLAVEWLP